MSDRVKQITWDTIKKICNDCELNNSDLLSIEGFTKYRSTEVDKLYNQWKEQVGESYLLSQLFNNITVTDRNHDPTISNNNNNYILRINDFPYNFEAGIEHYVLWLNPSRNHNPTFGMSVNKYIYTPRMDPTLLDEIKQLFPDCELVHFRNSSAIRTVNSIDHYHIIVKKNIH